MLPLICTLVQLAEIVFHAYLAILVHAPLFWFGFLPIYTGEGIVGRLHGLKQVPEFLCCFFVFRLRYPDSWQPQRRHHLLEIMLYGLGAYRFVDEDSVMY